MQQRKMLNSIKLPMLCVALSMWRVGADECVGLTPCSCQFADGTTIDLSPLSSSDVSKPTFLDVRSAPSGSNLFSWNPCSDFQEGDVNCQDVAVCYTYLAEGDPQYFNLGNTASASFSTDEFGTVSISYQFISPTTPIVERDAHIDLTCDTSSNESFLFPKVHDPSSGQFFFELRSKYCCGGQETDGSGSGGLVLSVGTVICFVFVGLAVIYMAAGTMFNSFYRKNTGIDRIPHSTFWITFPGLLKDGCMFLIRRSRRTVTYDVI